MRKFILLTLFFSATIISCTTNNDEVIADAQLDIQNACTAENPLELEWMQDLITELNCGEYACKVAILKSEYESETVFYIQMTDPVCLGFDEITLYNCTGKKVESFSIEESREFVNSPGREVEEIFSCNE